MAAILEPPEVQNFASKEMRTTGQGVATYLSGTEYPSNVA
jgi:hypothetical protein